VANQHNYASPDWALGRALRDALVDGALKTLRELEEKRRPDGGEFTAREKDADAFHALACAGTLVELLAGWAIDHTVGLALNGLPSLPLQPSGTETRPEYLAAQTAADHHRHQQIGRAQKNFEEIDPIVSRQILINLLRANPGGFPLQIQEMIVEALPMVKPVESNRKVKLRALRLQLKAIEFVEYRCAKGMLHYKAREQVGEAYRVSDTTVRLWEPRLREELGQLAVSRNIQHAKNIAAKEEETQRQIAAGLDVRKTFAGPYGEQALKQAAARYNQVIRED
jgi:hypothetical protein